MSSLIEHTKRSDDEESFFIAIFRAGHSSINKKIG